MPAPREPWPPKVRVNRAFLRIAGAIVVLFGFLVHREALYLRAGVLHVVTGQNAGKLVDLWITDDDVVTGVFESGLALTLKAWRLGDGGSPPPQHVIPLGRLLGIDDKTIDLYGPRAALQAEDQLSDRLIPYALSVDGTRIAWYWAGNLTLARLPNVTLAGAHTAQVPDRIQVLSFLGAKSLAGVVEEPQQTVARVWTLSSSGLEPVGARQVIPSEGRWSLWPRGSRLALASSPTCGFWLFDSARSPIEIKPAFAVDDGRSFALRSNGTLLVGTREGAVVLPLDNGTAAAVSPGELGTAAISAVAEYSDRIVLTAREDGGLYSIRDMRQSVRLAQTPSGVTLLATNRRHVAFATPHMLAYFKVRRWPPSLTDAGKWLLGLMFSVLGLLNFLRPVWADKREARAARRIARGSAPAPTGSG